jgi:acyl-coenzyme A synthetase/AMP-(fatty) acid ligase
VPQDEPPPEVLDLLAFVAASGLAPQKRPEHVAFVTELPRTASGKIRKDVLRQMIAQQLSPTAGA